MHSQPTHTHTIRAVITSNYNRCSLIAICYSLWLFCQLYGWIFFLIFRTDEFVFGVQKFIARIIFKYYALQHQQLRYGLYFRAKHNIIIVWRAPTQILNLISIVSSNHFSSFLSSRCHVHYEEQCSVKKPWCHILSVKNVGMLMPAQPRNVQNVHESFQFSDHRKSLITLFSNYSPFTVRFADFVRHILKISFPMNCVEHFFPLCRSPRSRTFWKIIQNHHTTHLFSITFRTFEHFWTFGWFNSRRVANVA